MVAARKLDAGLDLLDRQLRDRSGVLCGKVDDLELEVSAEGALYVTAIVTGAGGLSRRLGRRRLGTWQEAHHEQFGTSGRRLANRIPMRLVRSLGAVIDVELDADELSTSDDERWVRDHVVSHIPGSRHAGK